MGKLHISIYSKYRFRPGLPQPQKYKLAAAAAMETELSKTSDMGKKTVSVLAQIFMQFFLRGLLLGLV